jgi:tRNA G18 (ribose-2'-O)-methylase SpoU
VIQVLGQQHNLSAVIRVVRDLAIDGLHLQSTSSDSDDSALNTEPAALHFA